jgi:hypothetical protein
MALCALINISLDISTNITWWIITTSCKYTFYGTYYLITIIRPPKPTKEEIELMELKNEITQLNKKLYIIHNIHNNPHIINRNQLMLQNKQSDDIYNNTFNSTLDDSFDLSLLDDFIILNNDNQETKFD